MEMALLLPRVLSLGQKWVAGAKRLESCNWPWSMMMMWSLVSSDVGLTY